MIDTVLTWAGVGLLCLGSGLTLITALGLARFSNMFSRMHAVTKSQTLGLLLGVAGVSLIIRQGYVTLTLLLVVIFQLVTAPISAHMLGRKAYSVERVEESNFAIDEYTEDVIKAKTRAENNSKGH